MSAGALFGLRTGAPVAAAVDAGERAPTSLEDIYVCHGSTIARWVANLGGPRIEAADVVQDVFLAVQERLPSFRGDASLTTWLYRITANVVSEHRRRLRRRPWFGPGRRSEVEAEQVSGGDTAADAALGQVERRRVVYAVLDRLNERHRTVLVLFEIEERGGAEIATLLGMNVNAVWALLHRARAAFVRELRKSQARNQEIA